jgi:hypothetical protein
MEKLLDRSTSQARGEERGDEVRERRIGFSDDRDREAKTTPY